VQGIRLIGTIRALPWHDLSDRTHGRIAVRSAVRICARRLSADGHFRMHRFSHGETPSRRCILNDVPHKIGAALDFGQGRASPGWLDSGCPAALVREDLNSPEGSSEHLRPLANAQGVRCAGSTAGCSYLPPCFSALFVLFQDRIYSMLKVEGRSPLLGSPNHSGIVSLSTFMYSG
jgi:hypothetical protein